MSAAAQAITMSAAAQAKIAPSPMPAPVDNLSELPLANLSELVRALSENGFANDSSRLEDVIINTIQDAQYSSGAGQNLAILRRYGKFGHLTVRDLRLLADL